MIVGQGLISTGAPGTGRTGFSQPMEAQPRTLVVIYADHDSFFKRLYQQHANCCFDVTYIDWGGSKDGHVTFRISDPDGVRQYRWRHGHNHRYFHKPFGG